MQYLSLIYIYIPFYASLCGFSGGKFPEEVALKQAYKSDTELIRGCQDLIRKGILEDKVYMLEGDEENVNNEKGRSYLRRFCDHDSSGVPGWTVNLYVLVVSSLVLL